MNDYKELIERCRDNFNACNSLCSLDYSGAADAIEQLVKERDAAVADIGRVCAACKHFEITHNGDTPDYYCHNADCRNISGINTGWEWRGVQE